MSDNKKKLIGSLMKYFTNATTPAQAEARKERMKLMYQTLPEMTESDTKELLVRLLKRCKFEPTIAEIMDEWRTLQRCKRAVFVPKPREEKRVFSPKVAKLLAETQRAIRNGEPIPGVEVDSTLITFARNFFPGISLETITRNKLELSCCLMERQRELDENCRYRTVPVMDSNGEITCCMRKIV